MVTNIYRDLSSLGRHMCLKLNVCKGRGSLVVNFSFLNHVTVKLRPQKILS